MTYTLPARVARPAIITLFLILILPVMAYGRSRPHPVMPVQDAAATPPSVSIDLDSFGAVGDGVTDDGPALQRALDALAQSTPGSDATLVISEGRYALLTPVAKEFDGRLNSLTIKGPLPFDVNEAEGPGRGLGLSAEFLVKVGAGADALTITELPTLLVKDVTFIGDPSVGTDARVVLALREIESATVRHCEFYGLASLVAEGAILYAHHSHLKLEDSAFLGSTTTTGHNTSVVQNTLWRGITISRTRFIDYGNRPDYFSKTPHAAPLSWISIGNAAAPDQKSDWREAIINDVFLDEGAYIGLTCRPDLFAPYMSGSGLIDLVHISGLRMNVSNLNAHGALLTLAKKVMIERSLFGWSHNADTAINLANVNEAIIDQTECIADATTIRADASVGRLDVVNSIYLTLDSHAQITNVVNTEPQADPVQYVRQQYLDLLGHEPDPAGLFYWAAQLLRCGDNQPCATNEKLALANYLGAQPAPVFNLSGSVVDEDGKPMPGVTITLTGSQSATASTDNEGRYRFVNLPTSGVYTLTPSRINYTFNAPSQTFRAPNGDRIAEFAGIINRYTITGRVTDQNDNPFPGATVTLSGSQSASAVTGSDGTYRFSALRAGGTYNLTPSKSNHMFSPSAWTFENLTSNQTAPRFAALPVTRTIHGRITNAEGGAGLSGVRVDLGGSGTGAAFTDANGNYSFSVAGGGNYSVTPTRANYTFLPATLSFANLSGDTAANFTGTLNNYTISGFVTDEGSAPLRGVRMLLSGDKTGETVTGGDGSYSFSVRGEGTYTIRAAAEGYSFRSFTTGQPGETITAVNRHQTVNFTGRSSHVISGKVATSDGVGVSGVLLSLSGSQSATATTDANGNYRIVARAMGNYIVTPSKTNYDFTPQSLAFNQLDDDRAANFAAAKNRHTIGGHVVNGSGIAIVGATVVLSGAQNKTSTTDAGGRYAFDELQPGLNYAVAVSKINYTFAPPNRALPALNSDQMADFVGTLVSYRISGRVTTNDGTPLAEVAVALSGSQSSLVMTDARGEYSFTVTAEGNYTLTPSKRHYTHATPGLTFDNIGENKSANFTATLNRHTISGRITGSDGASLAGVAVSLSGSQASVATTGADGSYSFTNLPAGRNYILTPAKPNYAFSQPSRTVDDLSANTVADFTGDLVSYIISGRVTMSGGAGVGGVVVALTGAQVSTAATDEGGNYSFTVKAEGDYAVTPSKIYYTFNSQSLSFNNLSANQTGNFAATLHLRISGRVTTTEGNALAGVSVMLSGKGSGTTTTDADGRYSFTVNAEGSYTVTGSRANYTLTPPGHTFDLVGASRVADFTATLNTYTIQGTITDGLKPLGGVKVVLSGGQAGEALTNDAGVYSFSVKAEGDYTVTPSRTNYIFSPLSQTFIRLGGEQVANFSGNLIQLMKFSEAAYKVSEGSGVVQLTVVRVGEISGAAQVNYATTNATASDRSDYSGALGTLRFAPGVVSQTFNIFINDDALLENAETFSVALNNPVGATFDAPATAIITIDSNDTAEAVNPVRWDANFNSDFFLRQHYVDFLNREPDAGGFAFWKSQLDSCATQDCREERRVNVSAAFFLSPEFQETGYHVIRVHRAAFGGRSSNPALRIDYRQFIGDARQVGEGFIDGQSGSEAKLSANKQTYAAGVVTSAAFVARFPLSQTMDEYVDALYTSAGVTPTTEERQAAIKAGGAGATAGRAAALTLIADSPGVRNAELRPAFVLMEYFGYLRRNPSAPPDADDAGYQFWLMKLNEFGGNHITAEMVKAFITSPEYIGRFGH